MLLVVLFVVVVCGFVVCSYWCFSYLYCICCWWCAIVDRWQTIEHAADNKEDIINNKRIAVLFIYLSFIYRMVKGIMKDRWILMLCTKNVTTTIDSYYILLLIILTDKIKRRLFSTTNFRLSAVLASRLTTVVQDDAGEAHHDRNKSVTYM